MSKYSPTRPWSDAMKIEVWSKARKPAKDPETNPFPPCTNDAPHNEARCDAHVKNALYKSLNQKLQSCRDEHSRLGALLGMGGPGQAKTSKKEKAKLQKQHDKHTLAIWELEDQRETWIAFKDSTIESSRTWRKSIIEYRPQVEKSKQLGGKEDENIKEPTDVNTLDFVDFGAEDEEGQGEEDEEGQGEVPPPYSL